MTHIITGEPHLLCKIASDLEIHGNYESGEPPENFNKLCIYTELKRMNFSGAIHQVGAHKTISNRNYQETLTYILNT